MCVSSHPLATTTTTTTTTMRRFRARAQSGDLEAAERAYDAVKLDECEEDAVAFQACNNVQRQ